MMLNIFFPFVDFINFRGSIGRILMLLWSKHTFECFEGRFIYNHCPHFPFLRVSRDVELFLGLIFTWTSKLFILRGVK